MSWEYHGTISTKSPAIPAKKMIEGASYTGFAVYGIMPRDKNAKYSLQITNGEIGDVTERLTFLDERLVLEVASDIPSWVAFNGVTGPVGWIVDQKAGLLLFALGGKNVTVDVWIAMA